MRLQQRQSGIVVGRRIALAIALLVGSVSSAGVPEATLQTSLRDLDSESLEAREQAAATLRAIAGNSPERLLALITRDSSPEQRERLIGLAHEVFYSTPRGALGVSFGFARQLGMAVAEEQYEEGIPIESTIEGFDSANVLKSGDLLRSVDGFRVRTNLQCQLETISRDKGQIVQLEIEREGRPMRVSVCLGSRRELRAQTPAPEVMEAAWKLRLARSTAEQSAPPAIASIPALAWAEADRLCKEPIDPESEIRRASLQRPELQIERLLPDGSRMNLQREGTPAADLVATGAPRAKVSTGTPQSRMLASRPQQVVNMPGDNRNVLIKRVQELRTERQLLLGKIEATNLMVTDPNIPREQRQVLRQTLDGLEADLAVIQAQIDQLMQIQRNR
jgi:hypothetical protein